MTRRPTPTIIDAVLVADVATPDRTALRNRLRWDYSQVAPVDRKAVEDAAVDILANGQRMQQSVIAIGERLIAVKRLLDHGQFGDWCDTEFSMSIRTAQNLMNVAREFAGKNETVSLLTDSAMYLLAAPSTPPAAREQAIDEAQATGKSPTKERVREIIAEHKPGPVPAPTDKEYSADELTAAQPLPTNGYASQSQVEDWLTEIPAATSAQLLEAAETLAGPIWNQLEHLAAGEGYELSVTTPKAALRNAASQAAHEERRQERSPSAISNQQSPMNDPAPVTVDAEPAPRIVGYSVLDDIALRDMPAPDGRIPAARALINLYREVIATENQYGALTGQFSDWLAPKRELQAMIGHLEHLIAVIQHPEEAQ